MKMTTAITSILASTGLAALTLAPFGDTDPVRYSVVHYDAGNVVVMDTTVQDPDAYPVEQFLADHGLDARSAEIIYLDELEGSYSSTLDHDVWMMPSVSGTSGKKMFCITETEDVNSDGKGGETEVRVKNYKDENGNIVTEKWINGEKVEGDEGAGDMIWIEENDTGEGAQQVRVRKMTPGAKKEIAVPEGMQLLDVQVEQEIDSDGNETVQVWINGEEVDPSALDTLGISPQDAEVIIEIDEEELGEGNEFDYEFGADEVDMEVQVEKTLDEDGNEVTQVWINGEEVDPSVLDSLENAEGYQEVIIHKEIIMEGEGEDGENKFVFMNGGGQHMAFFGEGAGHTIVLVSSENGSEKAAKPERSKLDIENLSFSPNPNGGQFELSFNLPQSGKTEVVVYATDGRTVYQQNLGKFSGPYRKSIDISNEGAGTYILHVKQGKKTLAEKLIIQ